MVLPGHSDEYCYAEQECYDQQLQITKIVLLTYMLKATKASANLYTLSGTAVLVKVERFYPALKIALLLEMLAVSIHQC